MNERLHQEILNCIDLFEDPITQLSVRLRLIKEEHLKVELLRQLGEIMRILDGKIARYAREGISRDRRGSLDL